MARDFNGSTQSASLGDIALDAVTLMSFSIWAWHDALADFAKLFSKFTSTTSRFEVALGGSGLGDNNEALITLGNGSNSYGHTSGLNIVTTGAWHHWFVSYDGGQATNATKLRFWFDGVEKTLTYSTPAIPTSMATNAAAATLGATTGAGGQFMDGKLGEFALWTGGTPGGRTLADVIAALVDGYSPSHFRKNGIHYLPLIGRDSPEIDLWSATTATLSNSPGASPHPRIIRRRPQIWVPRAASATNLVVADATHGHTTDGIALTQDHFLTIAEAAHAHTTDGIALTQVHVLAVAEALHAHVADNIVLTVEGELAVADAVHAHLADNLELTQAHVLAIIEAMHAHFADSLTLTTGALVDELLGSSEPSRRTARQVLDVWLDQMPADSDAIEKDDNDGLEILTAVEIVDQTYGLR